MRNIHLFNKHYDTWLDGGGEQMFTTTDIELVNKYGGGGKQMEQEVVNQGTPTKESITKEILQKKEILEIEEKKEEELLKRIKTDKNGYEYFET
jgi:hypothetical protein